MTAEQAISRIAQSQYDRISAAHGELFSRIAKAGGGPQAAGRAASAKLWREHGDRIWMRADLEAESRVVRTAIEGLPDYQEWISLSAEADQRIARNRQLGRPLLAYTDADWDGA